MITENKREGLMNKSIQFIKDYKKYKRHSLFLKKIQEEFEKSNYNFNNMTDIENIILILNDDGEDESFISKNDDDGDGNGNFREYEQKTKSIRKTISPF